MNKKILEESTQCWLKQAHEDLREKLKALMKRLGTNVSDTADALNVLPSEVREILYDENPGISLELFIKILTANGFVIDIQDIEDSPVPPIPGLFDDEEDEIDESEKKDEEDNPGFYNNFNRQQEPLNTPKRKQPRGKDGRFLPYDAVETEEEKPVSKTPNFGNMSIDELIDIIEDKLWDDEIDVYEATKQELVDFLNEKDKKMKNRNNPTQKKAPEKSSEDAKKEMEETIDIVTTAIKKIINKDSVGVRKFLKEIFDED